MSTGIIAICVIAYIMIGIFFGELLFDSKILKGLTILFLWPPLFALMILRAIVIIPSELGKDLRRYLG